MSANRSRKTDCRWNPKAVMFFVQGASDVETMARVYEGTRDYLSKDLGIELSARRIYRVFGSQKTLNHTPNLMKTETENSTRQEHTIMSVTEPRIFGKMGDSRVRLRIIAMRKLRLDFHPRQGLKGDILAQHLGNVGCRQAEAELRGIDEVSDL